MQSVPVHHTEQSQLDCHAKIELLRDALGHVIRGKPEAIDLLLIGILSGGHILLEDVPGVGKTTLAKALARCFSVKFARVQFTPDLLPSDIIGSVVLDPTDGSFSFRAGPVFTNVLLADEINRASPRTQSALLEAMNESQVTVDGSTHPLPGPFFVLATQNPVDFQGTYPLPEAQLDRFLLRFGIGYPALEEELEVLFQHQGSPPIDSLQPVASVDELRAMQDAVKNIEVKPNVARYLLQILIDTRRHSQLELGVSTRGALALFRATQARAYIQAREFVTPDDVQALTDAVLTHRLLLTAESRYGGRSAATILSEIVSRVDVPL